MLAARLYGVNDIRLEDVPVPQIRSDELLLRVRAASICGTDIRMIRNGYGNISQENPRILGHELAGEIADVGCDVTEYTVGQRVTVAPNMGCGVCNQCVSGKTHMCKTYRALGINMDGGFAEYVKIPAVAIRQGNIAILPDHVSYEEAALNEPLSCVYNGSEQCAIRPGDFVLVIGAGPIGIMHGMLAKMAGAGRVYFNDLSKDRLEMVKKIDSTFITIQNDLEETIMKETNGEGVDVVITACPSPEVQSLAPELCNIGGRVNFFGGVPASRQPVGIDTNLVHYKQLILTGTTRASLMQFRKTLSFVESGILNVKQLISNRIPLKDFKEGIEKASAADGMKNVIVL